MPGNAFANDVLPRRVMRAYYSGTVIFLLSGSIAYIAWTRGLTKFHRNLR